MHRHCVGGLIFKTAIFFLSFVFPRPGFAPLPVIREESPWFADAQIRCIGAVPQNWETWIPEGLVDVTEELRMIIDYSHPREICAESQYGGHPIWNAGFRCVLDAPPGAHPVTGDDRRLVIRENRDISKYISPMRPFPPRIDDVYEFCRLRCRCFGPFDVVDPLQRPAQVILDDERDPPAPYDINPIYQPNLDIITDDVEVWPFERTDKWATPQPSTLTTTAPICEGPLPPWALPAPFAEIWRVPTPLEAWILWDRAQDTQQLCAANWFNPARHRRPGGAHSGNAGVTCQLDFEEDTAIRKEVLVVEDYLAHPALSRFNVFEQRLGLAVELWCRRACYCPYDGEERRLHTDVPHDLDLEGIGPQGETGHVIFHHDGSIDLLVATAPGSYSTYALAGAKAVSDSCESYDGSSCEAPPLEDLLARPKRESRLDLQHQGGETSKTCGAACKRQSDCGDGCLCAVNSSSRARLSMQSGSWTAFAGALCVATSRVWGHGSRQRLGGRSLEPSWQCVCNGTHVGPECCK